MIINNAVLYDIVADMPLSHNNEIDTSFVPERMHPNHRYFIPYEPVVKVDEDKRLYDYYKESTPKSDVHPSYPLFGQWLITHNYVKRSQVDVFMSIDNARRAANATLIDNDLYSMGIGITVKKLSNIVLSPEENQILLDIVDVHNKIMSNYDNASDLKTAWLANQSINLNEGWQQK